MSFDWLQYIGNPYSVIAVLAAIAGISLRVSLGRIKKPTQNFVLVMYGMLLVAVLALIAGRCCGGVFAKWNGCHRREFRKS
jgi:hypothetical protein